MANRRVSDVRNAFVEVGRIIKPHGLRGELKVHPFTSCPADLNRYRAFFIITENNHFEEFQVQSFRKFRGVSILKLDGIEDRSAADQFRNRSLFVAPEQLPELEKDEYFIRALIGIEVLTDEGEALGTLTDVLELPAHDVYQVQREERELLIPAISGVILEVKLEERQMIVRLPAGLREPDVADK